MQVPRAAADSAARAPGAAAGSAAGPARLWPDRLGHAQLAALRTGGWPVPAVMPGGLTLFGASETGASPDRVVDLAYSDGLSVISLFLQRGQLPGVLPGWRQTALGGHPVYLRNPAEPDLTWSAGGYVYTVVAGAPAPVIASVVDSLPHQGRPGFWGRMNRGMRRMLSWINPFH
jgi:sigma-E factor negative regulatory protein RseB